MMEKEVQSLMHCPHCGAGPYDIDWSFQDGPQRENKRSPFIYWVVECCKCRSVFTEIYKYQHTVGWFDEEQLMIKGVTNDLRNV